MELHRTAKGKIAESLVLARLLEHGLEVFEACVDVKGVDFVARAEGGHFVEIQVKGVSTERDPAWFQLQTRERIEDLRQRQYFVVGVTADREFWVFPPDVFFDLAFSNISTNDKGVTTIDLDLDVRRRGADGRNRDRLAHLKENWDGLCERYRGEVGAG